MFAGRRFRVRDVPQPYATVRKRPFEGKFAVPLGSFTGGVIFGRVTCLPPSFRVAGVALRDMWTFLATCGQSFFVAGAILLRRFHNMRDIFRGRRSTLDAIFRGRRSTSDVCSSDLSSFLDVLRVSNLRFAWPAWHFVTCGRFWQHVEHRFSWQDRKSVV